MVAIAHEPHVPTCETIAIHPDAVSLARAAALDSETLQQASSFFAAFADPTRLRILVALHKQELCVCDLAAVLDTTSSAVSHQLRLLRLAQLVASRRQGKIVYYRLNDDHITRMIECAIEHVREDGQPAGIESGGLHD